MSGPEPDPLIPTHQVRKILIQIRNKKSVVRIQDPMPF
jgi:hypothetical protein